MNPADLQTFREAVSLAQFGKKTEAHAIFVRLNQLYPNNFNVWLWLAFTSSDLTIARYALQTAARLEPNNPALPGAQAWLQKQERQQPPTPPVLLSENSARNGPAASRQTISPTALPLNRPRRSGRPDFIIVGGVVLLLVILIAVLILLNLNLDGVGEVPPPPAAHKVALSPEDQQDLLQTSKNYSAFNYGFYATTEKPETLKSFYATKMKEKGWELSINGGYLGSGQVYLKGDRGVIVLFYGPLTKKDLNSMDGRYRDKFNLGETFVVVFEGNSKDVPKSL
jgi:hypothetical protein